MKLLTVRQPWAHLIASGKKVIENRRWQTPYRGLLAIQAGKTMDKDEFKAWQRHGIELTFGAIVCVVRLADVWNMTTVPVWALAHEYAESGCGNNFWHLDELRVLKTPIPWRGMPGLVTLDTAETARILRATGVI